METSAQLRRVHTRSSRENLVLPVGQQGHLAELLDDLSATIDGNGGVVVIGGEAGIGKTTLVRSLAAEAVQRNVRVLEASCFELYSTPAFGPWQTLFAALEQDPSSPSSPAAFRGGSALHVTDQAALFASVHDYFAELTGQEPALLVLEDLQWSDPASLDLLRDLSRRASRMPLLIVVTYRTDDLERNSPFYQRLPALARETHCRRIELHRLDRDQVRALVNAWMDLSPADSSRIVDYLARHSDGNPFFATELIRALRDRGLLRRTDDRWELAELDQLVLPPLLMQVIDSRVSRLGNDIRQLLAIAAIIGQEVSLLIWSEVAGTQPDELLVAVERASDAHLMEADDRGTSVRFVHALTQNALYASVLPPRRREWHDRVARVLMATPDPDPDRVAYHLQMAGDPETWRWLVKAAERARNAYAWTTAAERFRMAVKELRACELNDTAAEGKLVYTLAFLLRFSDPAGAAEEVRQARRFPELIQDPIRDAESLWVLGTLLCYSNQFRAGLACYDTMIESLQPLIANVTVAGPSAQQFIGGEVFSLRPGELHVGDQPPRISTAMSLSDIIDTYLELVVWLQAASGLVGPARERMDRPHRIAEADDAHTAVFEYSAPWVSLGKGIAAAALGLPDRARNDFAESRASFRLLAHHALEVQAILVESADVAATYGMSEPSYRRLLASEGEAALRRAGGALRSGLSPRIAWLRCMALDGKWAEATDILESSPPPGNAVLWRNVHWATATLARYRGDTQLAWDHIRQVFPTGPELSPGVVLFHEGLELQRLAADLCLDAGEIETAREWLTAHDRWLDWSDTTLGVAACGVGWARLHMAELNDDDASLRISEALRLASDPDQPGVRLEAHRLLGELALRAGRVDEAATEAIQAIALAETCELPYERALAQVLLSESWLEGGRRTEATAPLTEALSTFSTLEAWPALQRAESLATQLDLRPAAIARSTELTEREQEVLRLIVAGRSNQAIADDLFISWTTARTHVSNILRKLGVSTRAEAVDVAHRRGLVGSSESSAANR